MNIAVLIRAVLTWATLILRATGMILCVSVRMVIVVVLCDSHSTSHGGSGDSESKYVMYKLHGWFDAEIPIAVVPLSQISPVVGSRQRNATLAACRKIAAF
jgi:hypothetical protein